MSPTRARAASIENWQSAIAPAQFVWSHGPYRYFGPHAGQRLAFFHAHFKPMPECPWLTHLQEVWSEPDHLVPPHIHAVHEITYVVSGRGRWQIEGQSMEVRAGDVWLIRPGEIHSGGTDPEDPYRLFVLGIDPAALFRLDALTMGSWAAQKQLVQQRRAQGALILDEPIGPWTPANTDAPPYDFGILEHRRLRGAFELGQLFKRMLDEMDNMTEQPLDSSSRLLSAVMLRALLMELFVLLARGNAATESGRFDTLCRWLQTRLDNPPAVPEMAAYAGLSPNYFSGEFKQATGKTPQEYIRDLRLEKAAELLRTRPSEPITSIALDFGFASAQHFSQVFRRHYNCTPSQWRRTATK